MTGCIHHENDTANLPVPTTPEPAGADAALRDAVADAIHYVLSGEVIQRGYPSFLHGEGSYQCDCYGIVAAIRPFLTPSAPASGDAALLADLRAAVELADTRTDDGEVSPDGTVSEYVLSATDWNRVVAIARGSKSEAAERAIAPYRAALTPPPPASGDAALRHAISVLENYGDHHEWCARAGGSGEPCNCGLWDELERLRFALTEGATE